MCGNSISVRREAAALRVSDRAHTTRRDPRHDRIQGGSEAHRASLVRHTAGCVRPTAPLLSPALNVWSSVSVLGSSPSVRSGHSSVFDSATQSILIFGGQQMTVTRGGEIDIKFHRDVWALDCSQMRDRTVRACQTRCAAPRFLWFADCCAPALCPLCVRLPAETWRWTKLPDSGDAPQRNGHTAILLDDAPPSSAAVAPAAASSAQMIVFGGSDKDGPSSAVWCYHLATHSWTPIATSGHSPEPRELHAACIVEVSHTRWMVITGGRGIASLLNTCHALRLPSATQTDGGANVADWEWRLVGQSPSRCAHSMCALRAAPAGAPVLPILETQSPTPIPAAPVDAASAAVAAAATIGTTAAASTPTSASLLLFGGTDGVMFYNDVLSFSFTPSALSASSAPPPACAACQGPPGWTILQRPEQASGDQGSSSHTKEESEEKEAGSALADSPSAAADADAKPAKKKSKKKVQLDDVQPPTCFAHSLTSVPCPSPAFARRGDHDDAAAELVPASFILIGGMNDEADLSATHFLTLQPFKA